MPQNTMEMSGKSMPGGEMPSKGQDEAPGAWKYPVHTACIRPRGQVYPPWADAGLTGRQMGSSRLHASSLHRLPQRGYHAPAWQPM